MTGSTNVAHLVQDLLRTADSVEYDDLAAAVMERLTPEQYEDALREILPGFCRTITRGARQSGPVRPPAPIPFPTRLSGAASKGATRTEAEVRQRASLQQSSWKVTAIRDGWQKRLNEVYSTTGGNKRLGDFTYADLMHQTEINERQAEQKMQKARGWRALAQTLQEAEVEHVRDLPAEILMHTLGAVA
jgi:hypothetical protein